jgi:hypothetical protein
MGSQMKDVSKMLSPRSTLSDAKELLQGRWTKILSLEASTFCMTFLTGITLCSLQTAKSFILEILFGSHKFLSRLLGFQKSTQHASFGNNWKKATVMPN